MEILKLLNENSSELTHECSIEFINGRAVIQFQESIPDESLFSNGFKLLNENDRQVQADYSAYKYVYKYDVEDNKCILTTLEGDVYVEHSAAIELTEEIKIAQNIAAMKDSLDRLDLQSIRSLRAILSGQSTEEDVAILSNLESQAQRIRNEMSELSNEGGE